MLITGSQAFVFAGSSSAAAAVAHLACIVLGGPAYRLMGAGEKMARAAEAGRLHPTILTLIVSGILLVWAAYAFGAAGVIKRLPFSSFVLASICAVYLTRAVAFPLLKPAFPGNSDSFWFVSSGICLVIGLAYLYGLLTDWHKL